MPTPASEMDFELEVRIPPPPCNLSYGLGAVVEAEHPYEHYYWQGVVDFATKDDMLVRVISVAGCVPGRLKPGSQVLMRWR